MLSSYQPDIGTVIALNTGEVITGADACSIEVLKPSGATASWLSVVGADTQSVEHTVTVGDFDELGQYILQAKVSIGGGTWLGSSIGFKVKAVFK